MKLDIIILAAIAACITLYFKESYIACFISCGLTSVLLLIQEHLDDIEYFAKKRNTIERRKQSRKNSNSGGVCKNT